MSKEFEVKQLEGDHGPLVSIKQLEGLAHDFFTGFTTINPILLTPFEAEQLIKELTDITKSARNKVNAKVLKGSFSN